MSDTDKTSSADTSSATPTSSATTTCSGIDTVDLSTAVPGAAPSASTYAGFSDAELIDIDHFARVKLRVGTIESVQPVPKSKKLLKLSVNLGSLGHRQVLAGVAPYFSDPQALVGRSIVVVANLKPAQLMGETSQGMLLAASTDDGSILHLVSPQGEVPAGSTVR